MKVIDGTLVSSNDGLVIRGSGGQVHALREWSNISFGELPGGLITRPTLEWDVVSGRGGAQKARVSYQTGGITWWADYNLIFTEGADANSGFVDVGAWVSLLNQSGARYPDAKLKLIAGDVNRVQPRRPLAAYATADVQAMEKMADTGLRGKVLLRVPPLHARPARDDPEQLDQADRAVPFGDARAREEAAHLLRG